MYYKGTVEEQHKITQQRIQIRIFFTFYFVLY